MATGAQFSIPERLKTINNARAHIDPKLKNESIQFLIDSLTLEPTLTKPTSASIYCRNVRKLQDILIDLDDLRYERDMWAKADINMRMGYRINGTLNNLNINLGLSRYDMVSKTVNKTDTHSTWYVKGLTSKDRGIMECLPPEILCAFEKGMLELEELEKLIDKAMISKHSLDKIEKGFQSGDYSGTISILDGNVYIKNLYLPKEMSNSLKQLASIIEPYFKKIKPKSSDYTEFDNHLTADSWKLELIADKMDTKAALGLNGQKNVTLHPLTLEISGGTNSAGCIELKGYSYNNKLVTQPMKSTAKVDTGVSKTINDDFGLLEEAYKIVTGTPLEF